MITLHIGDNDFLSVEYLQASFIKTCTRLKHRFTKKLFQCQSRIPYNNNVNGKNNQ